MVNNIAVKCIFFNQPYLKKKIELNQTITVKGKWNRIKQEITGNRVFFNSQGTQTQESADVQLNQSIVLRKVLNKSKYETKLDKH
ncbi:ATP-dependent DNA helicase RecG [Staphylococcus aureus]|nr:ATP-dependent DNA helicase RecG [Staphylococcus aureus]